MEGCHRAGCVRIAQVEIGEGAEDGLRLCIPCAMADSHANALEQAADFLEAQRYPLRWVLLPLAAELRRVAKLSRASMAGAVAP